MPTETKECPFALVATWREGVTDEERAAAETYIKELFNDLQNASPDDMPLAIETLTVKRVHDDAA